MSSVNGARQGRSTTVSRGRVHMWTRLARRITRRGVEVEEEKEAEVQEGCKMGRDAARVQWLRPSRLDPLN